ncbi:MAG: ATP-binding protein [Methanoregula sp.]|jgi:SpoVK/Ycf46/Vps4 family AAA+-type ATPase|uniref:ATP-binding protein n=1 Tax=Methanoregula sp. TaxID=2052170 RepID=UPI003C1C8A2C
MSGDLESLRIMEVLLTAEIFNQSPTLDLNDLTPVCREMFCSGDAKSIKRPVYVSDGLIKRTLDIADAHEKIAKNPFVSYEDFGQRLKITTLRPAAEWFLAQGGKTLISQNPALAFFFESFNGTGISYNDVRKANPPYEDTKASLDAKITKLIGEDEKIRGALDLVIVSAPEEVEQRMDDLVCSPEQTAIIDKIHHALHHRDFLNCHRIYEIGKLLFVGPPGTGKTSLALAMSHSMHMPVLEVRLSMITSQYLGETSKNIDKIFELAKKLSPSILFIDEFDFVAKSRVSDDHGAMKRAVNALLKNIDRISLVKNSVLLIGATNHPQLLDEAAWRRFDEVVEFALPDEEMRREILKSVTSSMACTCDYQEMAALTEGFSGADIRLMVKEALLSALMDKREAIDHKDLEKGIRMVKNREAIRNLNWM